MIRLYRGFNEKHESSIMKNKWRGQAREPVNSNIHVHNYANEWFKNNFGVEARSRTIICSTDIKQAEKYAEHGCVMQILPEPPYRLIFSENVIDFLSYAFEINNLDKVEIQHWLSYQGYSMVADINHLPKSFLGEVMVDCENFYATFIQ